MEGGIKREKAEMDIRKRNKRGRYILKKYFIYRLTSLGKVTYGKHLECLFFKVAEHSFRACSC